MLDKRKKLLLARRLILLALSVAWLTPVGIVFLPWSLCEPIIKDFGISVEMVPMLKYWFVMSGAISGMLGCCFLWLLRSTDEKLKLLTVAGVAHIFLAVVLLTRGLSFGADSLVVIWDSSFCFMAGIVLILLAVISMREQKTENDKL